MPESEAVSPTATLTSADKELDELDELLLAARLDGLATGAAAPAATATPTLPPARGHWGMSSEGPEPCRSIPLSELSSLTGPAMGCRDDDSQSQGSPLRQTFCVCGAVVSDCGAIGRPGEQLLCAMLTGGAHSSCSRALSLHTLTPPGRGPMIRERRRQRVVRAFLVRRPGVEWMVPSWAFL